MKKLIAFAASVIAGLLLAGCDTQTATPAAPRLVEGKAFPKLTLEYGAGKSLSIDSFRGRMLVLNVWAAWCPPCRREMPSLEALSKRLDAQRFAVVGVSTDDDALLAQEFLQQSGITFANFFDHNGRIAKQFGLEVYPETFLIGPDGTLIQRVQGMRDWSTPEMIAFLEMTYDVYHDKAGVRSTSSGGRMQ